MKEMAINYFKFMRQIFCEEHLKICPKDSIAYQATLKEKEFYDMAIQALEQKPCEDAISRQAVLDLLENTNNGWIIIKVLQLPPVKPQEPKIGHWKLVQRGKYIDICCSNCGYRRVKEYAYNYTIDQISEQDIKDFFSNSNINFCENCGEKMQEVEE